MTDNQKIEAVKELAATLTAEQIRELSMDLDDLADDVAKVECEQYGHKIDNDHCGRPEHRFCRNCMQRETTIESARQAKANEATACKAELPSESLGSGSTLFGRMKGIFS